MIKTIDVKSGETDGLYQYLSAAVTPRPIAFVSTIDANGNKNLSPFSFFNVFSINPPILIFSPVRRVRNNTSKHTLDNVHQIKECVISLVTEEIGQQVSLSSCDFDTETNEFEKAGFTEVKSDLITPSRIKESPINFECKVTDIIALGDKGGAGSLVLCEVLKMHIEEDILDDNNAIDPLKLNIVSRLGSDWYGKTTKESLYKITKPISRLGMGIDKLPEEIRNSEILTGNELAILASAESIPAKTVSENSFTVSEKHEKAKQLLLEGNSEEAWQILL
ncbi:MAG: flavin reductase family protein [Pelagibacteraceae bacterium]|nr:flavin reductase family protein [Flavobacteriales bacterium]MBT5699060.1 flavin reductase family protein [Flavobacteriales bacterium]MBT6197174.1 flavin reductase family protein [Pelagibacteraceae bacterium]